MGLWCQRSNQILNMVSKLKPHHIQSAESLPETSPAQGTFSAQLGLGVGVGASRFTPHHGEEKGGQTGPIAGREACGFTPPFYYSFPLIFI